jgi:serine/threonine protein kinase
MTCNLNYSQLAIYGITQNPETNEYFMAFQYADNGSHRKYLTKNFSKLTWQSKLQILRDISQELYCIHDFANYVHADFHSGNILQDQRNNKNTKSYIADLGLSKKKDEFSSKDVIYGVMPRVCLFSFHCRY